MLQNIEKELNLEVEDMIERAQAQLTGHPKQVKLVDILVARGEFQKALTENL